MVHSNLCRSVALLVLAVLARSTAAQPPGDAGRCFAIEVRDEQTGRGVPLVELRTVANQRYYTDSNGVVAIDDPALLNQRVYFSLSSPGYQFPADGFGKRGVALDVARGEQAVVKIRRLNIAERLYRVTGQGIYRDTVLLGRKAPLRQPLLNAKVVGQDSVQAIPYMGKLYWFWGDTNRVGYPLGHFGTSGATSELPANGGLDPSVGIDLTYFTDSSGFSRPTCDVPGEGPKWIDGLMVVKDDAGRDRLVAKYSRMKGLERVLERGLVQWDDAAAVWKPLVRFDLNAPLYPADQPVRVSEGGSSYFYFGSVRVLADLKHVQDPGSYEAYTCLARGTRTDSKSFRVDRLPGGALDWGWKRDTARTTGMVERDLISRGTMKAAEARFLLHNAQTGQRVVPHEGSICWNAYRKRWIQIAVEIGGEDSYLGEVWYAEADTPMGPWGIAHKIATHPHYSFYNPVQHPFFDQEGGRIIYFEGTYSNTFSGNENPTPLYDYNQLLYRLDLGDPRLAESSK